MAMISRLRAPARLGVGLAFLAVALGWAPPAQAQGKKADFKQVTFKTFDGVELSGYYYPNPAGKKNAVAMLIHHVDARKGGNQKKDGWDDLAARLQKEGYAVLSFDFRGFGESKTVDADFWKHPHNNFPNFKKRPAIGKMPPTNIDHKDFNPSYYRYLVNDIAAAKAYLDRRNDDNELNTSSTIVIAAGEGATLASLWMAQECRRRRDKNPPQPGIPLRPNLADPEGKDLACGVLLSVSPTLAGARAPVGTWLRDVGKNSRVPLALVYGKLDTSAANYAKELLKIVKAGATGKGGKGGKGGPLANTGEKAIPRTKLSGSALLSRGLDTEEWIVGTYLDSVMEARGEKERRTRAIEKWRYYYDFPGKLPILVKREGEDVPRVDLRWFFPR
jgi:pimeloyl-ACP methyl ester carboxylesterase